MLIWLLPLLFVLCIWGLISKRDSAGGNAAGNIAVVGIVLLILVFAVILAIGAMTAS
jgi:hypothetical protein